MNSLVDDIKKEVMKEIQKYQSEADDHYDFWNEHIKYVYEEAVNLAKIYKANVEIVELGALLHDIALIKKTGTRDNHHINGAIIGAKILDKFNCPSDIKSKVLGCVEHHRSSKNATNIEEICVCDADILAHFDNIPMLFNSAFNRHNLNLVDAREWVKNECKKDYNDLSIETKKIFKDRYTDILNIVLGIDNE